MSSANRFFQDHIDDGSLVLWHDYRSGSLRDWSGRGNDGTATATVQWMDRGFFFPTGACIRTPVIDLTATNNVTLVALSACYLPTGASGIMAEFGAGLFPVGDFSFYGNSIPPLMAYGVLVGNVGASDACVPLLGSPTPDFSAMSLWSVNFDMSGGPGVQEVTTYRNGVLTLSTPTVNNNNTGNFGNNRLNIGSRNNGASYPFMGVIRSTIMTNRALTATEHAQMYDAVTRLG
jgi:hypothetical protein